MLTTMLAAVLCGSARRQTVWGTLNLVLVQMALQLAQPVDPVAALWGSQLQ